MIVKKWVEFSGYREVDVTLDDIRDAITQGLMSRDSPRPSLESLAIVLNLLTDDDIALLTPWEREKCSEEFSKAAMRFAKKDKK